MHRISLSRYLVLVAVSVFLGVLVHSPVSARVRNNGNTAITTPTTVTFYADNAYQTPIGSAVIPAGLGGCATGLANVTTTWADLAVGWYPYWVYVDSGQELAESNENDNVTSGHVQIFPNG